MSTWAFTGPIHPSLHLALGVMAYAVDPGMVNTGITRHIKYPLQNIIERFSFLLKTPAEGAFTNIYCVVTPENKLLTGGYYKLVCCGYKSSYIGLVK